MLVWTRFVTGHFVSSGPGVGDRRRPSQLIRGRGSDGPRRNVARLGDLHAWVLSLPWVVERPGARRQRGVRLFAVDCKPLGRRQMWLTTGPVRQYEGRYEVTVSVVLPDELSSIAESAGWGVVTGELPGGHVIVTSQAACDPGATMHLEVMLVAAYSYALS
jgi:hypothetical protein